MATIGRDGKELASFARARPPVATATRPVGLVTEERAVNGSYIGTCVPVCDGPRAVEVARENTDV